ncbi:radical SAM protein [Desulfosarcina cetonica]
MRQNKQKKIFLRTTFDLCDNNGYTTTQINNFFIQNGHEVIREPDGADYIVISTCGFDQDREQRAYDLVSGYIQHYSDVAKVIVCGCLASINPELFDSSKVTLIGSRELYKFNAIFQPRINIEHISGGAINGRFINSGYGFLDAYYLQICQGCVNHCSYCAIKKAKGDVKSKPPEQLIAELERAIQSGYRRVMLLGDDCGSYGADLGTNLAELLNIIKDYEIGININYIHPRQFQSAYPLLHPRTLERIEFINVPIQSTSRRILDLMNRPYHANDIFEIIREIKSTYPNIFFETHIIYGFPSEARAEFQDAFRAAEYFDSVIFFYYTDRKGVSASRLAGKIPTAEILQRTKMILDHPRFRIQRGNDQPPVVLLGYELETTDDIFISIENSLPHSDFVSFDRRSSS